MLGYNCSVRTRLFLQNTLILFALLTLIAAPPSLAGYGDLRKADGFRFERRYGEAASAYASAAWRLPWQPELWERAGYFALLGGDIENALLYFEKAGDHNALSPAGWLRLGDAFEQSGDMPSAAAAWEQSLADGYLYAHERLARLHRLEGDYQAAIEDLRALAAAFTRDDAFEDASRAAVYYQLGLLLAAISPGEAVPELLRAAQLDPELDEAVQTMRLSLNTGLIEEDRSVWFFQAGLGLGALQQWDLAEVAFRHAVELNLDYAEAWAWLGEARQQRGQDGRAELDEALRLRPTSAVVRSLFGLYWQRQHKPEIALSFFWTAVSLEPENAAWQAMLGGAYEQSGDLVKALEHYQSATQMAPKDAAYWRALATFSLRNDVDISGVGLLAARQLVQLAPRDWRSYDIIGQILLEMDDPPGAEALLKKTIEMAPKQADPHLHLGLVYLRTGEGLLAYTALRRACDLDPDGAIGQQAQRLLERYFP